MLEKIQRLVKFLFKQEYAKASIYYVVANIIGQGVVLLSSAIFTRMMSKADYGLVSTYSTWVLVINTFICMNLFISVRTAYIDFREDYDNYNSSILLLNIICGMAMTAAIVIITAISGMSFGILEVFLACTQSVALNIINFMLAIQAMKNEYRQRTLWIIAPNWTHIMLSILLILVFTQNPYRAKIAGNALGLLIFGVVGGVILFRKAKPRFIPRYWKYSLKLSIPSIFNTLSDLILMQSDRLMLTALVGAEETAEYSIIYNVSSIIVTMYQAINGAWTPWFFSKLKENEAKSAKRYQEYYLLAFMVFTCGMMTISPELIKILSPGNYWSGISYVAPIVIASYLIFLYTFFSVYLLYEKRTGRIAVNTVVAATLNFILNFLFIPQYKAVGAVIATVISYAVLFALHLIAVYKDGKRFFCIGKMCVSVVMIALYGCAFYVIRDYWIARYILLGIVFVLVYFTKGRTFIRERG